MPDELGQPAGGLDGSVSVQLGLGIMEDLLWYLTDRSRMRSLAIVSHLSKLSKMGISFEQLL